MSDDRSSDAAVRTECARRVVALAGEMDVDGLAAMLADDVVMQLPFAPAGFAREHRGRDEVERFQRRAARSFTAFAMTLDSVRVLAGEPTVVVEHHSEGRTTDGRRYANRYVTFLTFDPQQRIARWVEYYDPAAVVAAFGDR
jgi:ketosteroid isomerase-like protein